MSWKDILKVDDEDYYKPSEWMQRTNRLFEGEEIPMDDEGRMVPLLSWKTQKERMWNEAGHEIVVDLELLLEEGKELPPWAVVENNKIKSIKTGDKFIEEATKDNYLLRME